MHTVERRTRRAQVAQERGTLVAFDMLELLGLFRDAQCTPNRAATLTAEALGVVGRQESLRKRIVKMLDGRQERARGPELRALKKVLRREIRDRQRSKESVDAASRTFPVRFDAYGSSERHPAEYHASRVKRQLGATVSPSLWASIESDFEALLEFDSWYQAINRSSLLATDRRVTSLQAQFAKHVADALLVLLAPLSSAEASFDEIAWDELVKAMLTARNSLLNKRYDELGVLSTAQAQHEVFVTNQER